MKTIRVLFLLLICACPAVTRAADVLTGFDIWYIPDYGATVRTYYCDEQDTIEFPKWGNYHENLFNGVTGGWLSFLSFYGYAGDAIISTNLYGIYLCNVYAYNQLYFYWPFFAGFTSPGWYGMQKTGRKIGVVEWAVNTRKETILPLGSKELG